MRKASVALGTTFLAALIVIALMIEGNGSGETGSGDERRREALQPNSPVTRSWGRPIGPGEEWVVLAGTLLNRSDGSVTITDVAPRAPVGLGEVVEVTALDAAPFDANEAGPNSTTPGGLYKTYPPAFPFSPNGPCEIQALTDLAGFELEPGAEARISTSFRALGPGRFKVTGYDITYEQDGEESSQFIVSGFIGTVKEGARPIRPDRGEARCASEVELLPEAA